MCGISGFVDYNKGSTKETVIKMSRAMEHRGPDGEGYAIFENDKSIIGLGHRRLSILDLSSAGTQPFRYLQYYITFNGEVYNFSEIKKVLEQKGHVFSSHSDTEVIIHAYAEWGSNCIDHFIGMFAFVIYDDAKKELFGCRDRAGVKPFFYYHKEGLFLFGSELKSLMAHPAFEKNIDINAVGAYMQTGYVPAPHCIFKHTFKLEPGHFFHYSVEKNVMICKQYWNVYDAYNKPVIKIDAEDAVLETERLLKNAFQYRMVSDVPVGVFLSGGYDSSCVTALLQAESSEKIKTFTIGMPDAGLNEAPFAKKIASALGTDHTEYYLTEADALGIIPALPFYYDEPFSDSSAIPTMLVSRIAKEKVTVALSADGGDEIFGGYSRYQTAIINYKRFNKIPKNLRSAAAGVMNLINPAHAPRLNSKPALMDKYRKVAGLLQDPSPQNMLLSLTNLFTEDSIRNLFITKTKVLPSALFNTELNKEQFSILRYMMAVDYQSYLVDDILQKIDRAGMAVSLEGREPFLDHRIIEWAACLPDNLKINGSNKKFILKEIVHKYLPKEMMNRPKMGFGIPIEKWLKNEIKQFVNIYLSEEFIIKQGIFNYPLVSKIKTSFYKVEGNRADAERIWRILMFQMWYDKWINLN